ncbi:MAG: hypothetical protein ACR2N1_02085 [Rubripirellula sp.]
MPQKTSSKQKFPPQGVKQLPPSKPAFQQTSQSPSLFPNALLPTTEHQPLGFGFMGAGVGKRDERIHNRDWCCGSGVAALGTTACCQ